MKATIIFIVEDHKTYCKVIKEGACIKIFASTQSAKLYIAALPKRRNTIYRIAKVNN